MAEKMLTCTEALRILLQHPTVDLYMGADLRSWALTSGWGSVDRATVDDMLRTGKLARKWAVMPCYYVHGDESIEKVVRQQDEVMIPAVRDPDLSTAMTAYSEFVRLDYEERNQRHRERAKAAKAKREARRPA